MGGFAVDHSVGMRGRCAAFHADCPKLDDFVGGGEQVWHWSEWLPTKVLIESGADHVHASVCGFDAEVDDFQIKELHLLDEEDLGFLFEFGAEFFGVACSFGLVLDAHVRDDHRLVISVINAGLEDLDPLFSVQRTAGEANELFAFAGVHAAADDGELAARFQSRSSPVPSISASNISSNSLLTSSSVAFPSSRTISRMSEPDSGSFINSSLSAMASMRSSSFLCRANLLTSLAVFLLLQ